MSFVGPGAVVTYLVWLEQVQKLGLGDSSTPGEKERRMFEESGEFNLKVNSGGWIKCNRDADFLNGNAGSFYQNAENLISGTIPLGRIPTTLTGKDADLLDGNHGSFYRNAGNLNAGTVSRGRLGALWRDSDTDQSDSPFFQSGKATIPAGTGTQMIYFDYAYSETPRVVGFSSNSSSITVLVSVSTSSFSMQKFVGISYEINWIALGRKV